jgi:dihydrofolate reductase
MMSVSVDGYMEGPDRELDWQVVDAELHRHFNDWLATTGAFMDGRVTWELMAQHWPTADADPAASAETVEFAGIWRDKPKVVYSSTLEQAGWNTTIVRQVVPEEVLTFKAQPGGDLVLGGADLGATFMELDLIDEYRLYVQPMILGRGKPMFRPSDFKSSLRLAETRTFGSGVVLLRYERNDAAAGLA